MNRKLTYKTDQALCTLSALIHRRWRFCEASGFLNSLVTIHKRLACSLTVYKPHEKKVVQKLYFGYKKIQHLY